MRVAAADAIGRREDVAEHRYDEWTATLEALAREAGLNGTRLLDVACGTGKSFLPFLDRGYEVVACDVSPAMVGRAAAKAEGRARIAVHDMRELPRLGSFDLVCCLDDAVNYLLSAAELTAALRGMAGNLAPGGVLLFDANTLASYRSFFTSLIVMPCDDQVLIWTGKTAADLGPGGLAEATLEAFTRDGDGAWSRALSHHRQRHHPQDVVRAAVAEAGLRCVAVRGMFRDGSVTDACDELANTKAVYVATRMSRP